MGHYLCAILNSSPAVLLLYVTAQWVQTPDYQATDIQRLLIPQFDPTDRLHQELARLSFKAHALAAAEGSSELARVQSQVDRVASKLWGITVSELDAIQDDLTEIGRSKRGASEEVEA
jgi:hypothetical protein